MDTERTAADVVRGIMSGNSIEAKDAFDSLVTARVGEMIDKIRPDVSASLFSGEELQVEQDTEISSDNEEGLTTSRMYMNGTLRSWMHYVDIRCDKATQKEHRDVADQCKVVLTNLFPSLFVTGK